MTPGRPDNASPDPHRDDVSDLRDRLDVEAALAEATGLTNQLGSEIGTAGPAVETDAKAQNVEETLGEVEQLLKDVAGAKHESSLPNAASETDDAEPLAGPPARNEDADQPDDADDQDPTKTETVAGTTEASPESTSVVRPSGRSPLIWAVGLRWRRFREFAGDRFKTLVESTLSSLFDALDVVDGMFPWIDLATRRVIGWLALAILTAASVITCYSIVN